MSYHQEMDRLWNDVNQAKRNTQKIALLENIIQVADFHQDVHKGIYARMQLIDSEQRTKSVVALSWIWAQLDQNHDLYHELGSYRIEYLYHLYRSTIGTIGHHPAIADKENILKLIEDLCRRMKQDGYHHEIFFHKINIAMACDFQDREWAKQSFISWLQALDTHRKEYMIDDPKEWDLYLKARYYYEIMGDLDQSLSVGKPILEGHVTDGYIEDAFPSIMIIPLWKEGRLELANTFQRRTEQVIIQKEWYEDMAWHLCFMMLTNQLSRAICFFEEHVSKGFHLWDDDHFNPCTELDFLLHVGVLFQRLQHQGKKVVELNMSTPLPFAHIQSNTYDVDQAVQWIRAEVTKLATQFDQRNGNTHYIEKIAQYEKMATDLTP